MQVRSQESENIETIITKGINGPELDDLNIRSVYMHGKDREKAT